MNKNNIEALRNELFATLREVRNKEAPLDLNVAEAVCKISGQLIETAKLEISYLKVTGGISTGNFLPETIGQEKSSQDDLNHEVTATGVRKIESVAGGTITTHRMRG